MSALSLIQFADKMAEVMAVLMKGFAKCQMHELYKDKLTLPQMLILNFLHIENESKMKDLAIFMGVTTPAMTGIVDRLVKSGYCKREYDAADRRIIKISLTAKGNDLVKKINDHKRQMVINIFGKISEADREEYLRILLQIKEILLNCK